MSTFYICATPIGNLDDISKRLVDTLNSVDIVYAEDTRRGKKLLSHLDIKKDEILFNINTNDKSGLFILIDGQITFSKDNEGIVVKNIISGDPEKI